MNKPLQRVCLPPITLAMAVILGMANIAPDPAGAQESAGPTNLALGKAYSIQATWPDPLFTQQQAAYPDTDNRELTDGKKASTWYGDPGWQIFTRQGARRLDIDLGQACTVDSVMARFLQYRSAGVLVPRWVRFSLSVDGKSWVPVAQVETQVGPWHPAPKPEEFRTDRLHYAARYVRLEIPVDILVMADEVEVYGDQQTTPDALNLAEAAATAAQKFPPEMILMGADTPRSAWPGYLAAGSPTASGAGHTVLLPYGYPPDPERGEFTADDYLPYVAYLSEEGKPLDWMFDTVLLSPQSSTPSQHVLSSNDPNKMANKQDWEWYIEETFKPGYQLDALEQAVARAKEALGQPDYKLKVVLSLVNAPSGQRSFGDLDGDGKAESFDYRQVGRGVALANRLTAERWLLGQLLSRWEQRSYKNLQLIGIYWHPEGIAFSDGPDEAELVRQVAAQVHQQGLKFFWIPYFGTAGSYDWKNYGFDAAMLQPNYMFSNSPEERLQACAQVAQALGMGIEMEKHWNESLTELRKWIDYLNGGVRYGYIQALTGYYQGFKDFGRAARGDAGSRRLYYEFVYQFIRGTYQPYNLNW